MNLPALLVYTAKMKTNNILIIGGVAVIAYLLFFRKKKTGATSSPTTPTSTSSTKIPTWESIKSLLDSMTVSVKKSGGTVSQPEQKNETIKTYYNSFTDREKIIAYELLKYANDAFAKLPANSDKDPNVGMKLLADLQKGYDSLVAKYGEKDVKNVNDKIRPV